MTATEIADDAATLRQIRRDAGLSARQLDLRSGLSVGQTARYEARTRTMTLEQARRLCIALGVSLAAFDPPE